MMILRISWFVIVLFALSAAPGLASVEKMKIRAFALKPGTFTVKEPVGLGKGINVLAEIQRQFDIDLSKIPGAQAVYLPKERSLVLRAPEEIIQTLKTRMGRVMDRTRPAASGTQAVMQARLDAIILSEVKFTEANSEAAAEYIRYVAEPYGIAVQLLAQSTPETAPTVTLNLQNVPLSALLKYYTALTNLPHRVQADDVVVEY